MRNAGASVDPPSDPLPPGVSADIFGDWVPHPVAPVRSERPDTLPPPPPRVEPWPVAERKVREEEPPPPVPDPEPKGSLLRYLLIGVGALLLLMYLVPAVIMAGRILPGTTVLGVDIGGRTEDEAAVVLREGLYAQTRAPIIIRQGMRRLTVDPQQAGLSLDVEATLARASTGFPSPGEVWRALTGSREIEPVISVRRDQLAAAVNRDIAAVLEIPGREGGVAFRGVTPVPTFPRVGYRIDREAVAQKIEKAYLAPEVTVPVTVQVERPEVTRSEVRRAVDWAKHAVAAPLTLTDGTISIQLPPAAIAAYLSFVPEDGKLRPKFDAARAAVSLERRLAHRWFIPRGEAAQDAAFAIVGGEPRLVHARPGKRVDTERLAADVIKAVGGGNRRVEVRVTSGSPRLSDEEALKLGIKEEIGRFTVPNACCPPSTGNVEAAARLVHNRLVGPGETFSLNEVLGERQAASGFSGAITATTIRGQAGADVPGISSLATAMLNAVVRAGLEVVEHVPPEVHRPGAPAGLEAAVAYPLPDLRWRNDSPYGVLVQAHTTKRALRIALWSTKRFEVELRGPAIGATTQAAAVTQSGGDCVPTPGQNGFTAEVTRVLRQNGAVVRRQSFRTVYEPRAQVMCSSTR